MEVFRAPDGAMNAIDLPSGSECAVNDLMRGITADPEDVLSEVMHPQDLSTNAQTHHGRALSEVMHHQS